MAHTVRTFAVELQDAQRIRGPTNLSNYELKKSYPITRIRWASK
jgi:hypothetical protein